MPPNPATKAKIRLLEDDETKFPFQNLAEEAMKNMEWVELDKL
jgi:hypothetical protein